MNKISDSERVVAFRSDVPFPSPARLASGRERLLTAATTAGSGSAGTRRRARQGPFLRVGPFLRWRPVIAVSAAVAVAAGAGYVLLAHAGRATPSVSSATPSASSATPPGALAVQVLTDAAKVIGRSTVTEPSPGQWIFYEDTIASYKHPAPSTKDPEWVTFDGSHTAYYDGPNGTGSLTVHTNRTKFPPPGMSPWTAMSTYGITPKSAWDALSSLPASPRAALAVIAGHATVCEAVMNPLYGDGKASTPAQREFDCLASLMQNAQDALGGPPAGDAAAFGVMATLPGISVQEGIPDAAGAPAIGVSVAGGREQLLLSPATYQVIGTRLFSTGRPGTPWGAPKGAVLFSTVRANNKLVAAPGDR